jgi:hypothetical protein
MKMTLTQNDGTVVASWDSREESDCEFWSNMVGPLQDWISPEDAGDIKFDIDQVIVAEDAREANRRRREAKETEGDEARDRAKDERR